MSKLPLLIDSFNFVPFLEESRVDDSGKMIVRGEFARAGVATANNRIYPKSLWEREIKRLSKAMEARKVMGEADHPGSGRTSLKNVSHLMTKLWIEGEIVMGEAVILNTASGRDIRAILEATGTLGVSSRGFGTTRLNQEGKDVVQDDYTLNVFDFVADPANITSYPTVQNEERAVKAGKEISMADKQTLEQLRRDNPKLAESLMDDAQREFERQGAKLWAQKLEKQSREAREAREASEAELKTTFSEQLKVALEAAKAEVAKVERERLMSDPAVGAAKSALEDIKRLLLPLVMPEDVETVVASKEAEVIQVNDKISELELKLATVTAENAELAALAKEAGYRYHLETILKGHKHADFIRTTIGDLKTFESVSAIEVRVAEISEEINKQTAKQEERDAEMDKLREENELLRLAAEKSLTAAKHMALNSYIEDRLRHHPKSNIAKALIEAKSPATTDEVEVIMQGLRERPLDPAAIEEARGRVRQLVGGQSREYADDNVATKVSNLSESVDYHGLGQGVDQLRALSGIGNNEN